MDNELEQFRQEVKRLRAGRKHGALPYPEAMKAFAVRYLTQALEAGRTLAEVAEALGVSEPTLQAWRNGRPSTHRRAKANGKAKALAPVVASEPENPGWRTESLAGGLTVVAPGGFRVEGLSVEAAAQLLRKLGC